MIKKIITSKFISSISPIMKAILAFAGIFIIVAGILFIRTIIIKNNVSDQYDAIAVWQNNGEGNWDIAYSIYKQNNNKWFHQVDKDIYYEGDANLIAKLPGDDNDPDIASSRSKAIAVWSNTGLEGNKGADIVVSKWDSNGWSKPVRLFEIVGDDVDPTIYMQDSGHALAVWVNKNGANRTLYYSEYVNDLWSDPVKIPFDGANKIASPELGYITVENSRYLLVFTAQVYGEDSAYLGTYDRVNGWNISKISDGNIGAITDETIPAKYRTSVDMQVDSHDVAISWNGKDGNIWYVKASPSNLNFDAQNAGKGINPVIIYDPKGSNDADSILFFTSDTKELVNITPIGGSLRQVVSSNEITPTRADATYLRQQGNRSAVSVWETKKENKSEIYFSTVDKKSQKWTAPDRIDQKKFIGKDMNPSIASIIIQFNKESVVIKDDTKNIYKDTFCGNKILEKKFGEECEIGIACGNKDETCDWDYYTKKFGKKWANILSDCECLTPPDVIKPKTLTPGNSKKKQSNKKSEVIYGGASCGFDSVIIKSSINTEKVSLQFLPDTNPSNGIVVFNGAYPKYQSESFALFPLSSPPNDKYFVMANFSNNDNVITMIGIDATTGFQLCTGIFTKGAPPEGGGFVPASAGGDINVPSLPAN